MIALAWEKRIPSNLYLAFDWMRNRGRDCLLVRANAHRIRDACGWDGEYCSERGASEHQGGQELISEKQHSDSTAI